MPDAKRVVLFLVGTGLVLTLVVELVVLRGDIGRMNTVFKFYLQVWTLFAVSAAAAFGWLLESLCALEARLAGRLAGHCCLLLVLSALLFTGFATQAKIKDRMTYYGQHRQTRSIAAAHPGWHAVHAVCHLLRARSERHRGTDMDLSQDYRVIRWLQDNIQGSPVIVEAVSRNNYRWYSRVSPSTPACLAWWAGSGTSSSSAPSTPANGSPSAS